MTETTGALVIGGNLNGLSIARSLGRHGVPVWVTTPPNVKLAGFSRYALRTLPWPEGAESSPDLAGYVPLMIPRLVRGFCGIGFSVGLVSDFRLLRRTVRVF